MSQHDSALKVLLAIDSFKGSVSSEEACVAVSAGLSQACKAFNFEFKPTSLLVSDGGEGLVDCLSNSLSNQGYTESSVSIRGLDGKPYTARLSMNPQAKCALLESAQAIGLVQLPVEHRNGITASSYGLGQLIEHALNHGCYQLSIGLGGSATNDCGIGMMQALGVKFYDAQGTELGKDEKGELKALAAQDLALVASMDDSQLQQRIAQLSGFKVQILCDVDNPLLGPSGATYVFGRQKGIAEQDLAQVEQGMHSFAQVLSLHYQVDHTSTQGAGAAGGLGAALMYLFKGAITSGIEYVMRLQSIETKLQDADLVIVGEGCMDSQSVHGKAPVGVAKFAKAAGVPCIAICGAVKGEQKTLYEHNIQAAFSIAPHPMSVEESMAQASELLQQAAENIGRCFLLGRSCKA